MEKPQPGTDSTKALGATAPDPKQDIYWYAKQRYTSEVQGGNLIVVQQGRC